MTWLHKCFKDYDRLANGSMEYSTVDEPYYRTCVEQAEKIGKLQIVGNTNSSNNYFFQGYAKIRCVDSYEDLAGPASESELRMMTQSASPSPRPGSPVQGGRD